MVHERVPIALDLLDLRVPHPLLRAHQVLQGNLHQLLHILLAKMPEIYVFLVFYHYVQETTRQTAQIIPGDEEARVSLIEIAINIRFQNFELVFF